MMMVDLHADLDSDDGLPVGSKKSRGSGLQAGGRTLPPSTAQDITPQPSPIVSELQQVRVHRLRLHVHV